MAGKYSDGRSVVVAAPSGGTTVGRFYYVGGFLGCAFRTVLIGESVALNIAQEEFETTQIKSGDTFAAGTDIFWDQDNVRFTETPTAVYAGRVTEAKASGRIAFVLAAIQPAGDADELALAAVIGDPADLDTTEKAEVVGAINELHTELSALLLGVAGGYALARGVANVTGTADITTGLATVVAFSATLAVDPSADATVVSGVIPAQSGGTAGHLTLKVWKPTAADNSVPTAGLVAKAVSWIAIGTPAA